MGKCPHCGKPVGPLAIIMAWDKWGKFVCPGCEKPIQFNHWFITVLTLMGLFVLVERMLHTLLSSGNPLWLSFSGTLVLAVLILFMVPMLCRFKKTTSKDRASG
jgi:hypothetical protein